MPAGRSASAEVRRIETSVVDADSLSSADVILIDHPGRIPPESINLLAVLMRRGRPVVYVAAELIDATNLHRLAEAVGSAHHDPVVQRLLIAFLSASAILHFYYDGFLWKMRNPAVRANI